MILLALPLCAITGLIGYVVFKQMKTKRISLGESPATQFLAESDEAESAEEPEASATAARTMPSALVVTLLVLLPIVQIMAGTVGTMIVDAESIAHEWIGMLGSSAVALLTAVVVAYLVLGRKQRWSLGERVSILDSALPAVAVIVFVTGVDGVFANVLVESGIGTALSEALIATQMPLILTGFLIAAALRVSQGSATVAILTAAGILAQPIADAGYSQLQATLVCIALCFGGLGFSHINDSGFWIVTKYLGLSVKDGLKTWTVLSTIFGMLGFLLTWGVFVLVH